MTIITVTNKGTYGFDVTPLNGVGFSEAEATSVGGQVDVALALGDSIRNALAVARNAGLDAFSPSETAVLTLPPDMSDADREHLFATILGHAYSGGPIRLDQWSQAVSKLDHWAAAAASNQKGGDSAHQSDVTVFNAIRAEGGGRTVGAYGAHTKKNQRATEADKKTGQKTAGSFFKPTTTKGTSRM